MDITQLHTNALLIKLTWHYWTGEIKDDGITKTTNDSLGVKGDRGRYLKQLFSDDFMEPMRTHTSSTKKYYYTRTLPWEDKGYRLVGTSVVEEVITYLNQSIDRYRNIVRIAVDGYDYHVQNQQSWLTSAWNIGDYPSAEEFARRYGGSLRVMPLAGSDDIRLNLSGDTLSMVRQGVEADTKERFANAMTDCWNRIYKAVTRVVDRLSAEKPRIYDSLTGDIQELVDTLPSLNILNDTGLESMRKELENRLLVDVEVLRADEGEREEVAARARELQEIMEKMGIGAA